MSKQKLMRLVDEYAALCALNADPARQEEARGNVLRQIDSLLAEPEYKYKDASEWFETTGYNFWFDKCDNAFKAAREKKK